MYICTYTVYIEIYFDTENLHTRRLVAMHTACDKACGLCSIPLLGLEDIQRVALLQCVVVCCSILQCVTMRHILTCPNAGT